jgi:probable phosphoglycerate mutase
MRRVIIVRHGNTFDPGDIIRRVGQGTDIPLSGSGQVQAAALSTYFANTSFDRVISSPLKRTRQTATAIAQNIAFDDRLLEIDYGPDEGRPEDEVVARLGEDAIALWDKDAVPPQGWRVDPDQIKSDWADILAGSIGTTLIVTSNGIARFALDVAAHDGAERKLKTGAYGVIEEHADGWHVTAWNVRPPQS